MLTGNSNLIRQINQMAVLKLLQSQGPISRSAITRASGLSPSTVSSVVADLIKAGLVREIGEGQSHGGRRAVLLEIHKTGGLIIGVDLGGTKIAAGLVDLTAEIRHRICVPTPTNPDEILRRVLEVIAELAASPLAKEHGVRGVGIASPGLVSDDGVVVKAGNLNWSNVPLRERVTAAFGLPTVIENDTNAAALAEMYYGAAIGAENLVYISVGTGVGAGIITNGLLHRGARGGAGEIGHMRMERDGLPCSCGRRGCLETLAGGRAIARRAAELLPQFPDSELAEIQRATGHLTAKDVAEAADHDPLAAKVMSDAATYLGWAIGNLVNTFNPEVVVLGGGVICSGSFFVDQVEREARAVTLLSHEKELKLLASPLGETSGIIGAASLVVQNLFAPVVQTR